MIDIKHLVRRRLASIGAIRALFELVCFSAVHDIILAYHNRTVIQVIQSFITDWGPKGFCNMHTGCDMHTCITLYRLVKQKEWFRNI